MSQPLRWVISSVAAGSTAVQVADDAEVDELEDRRLLVLVDRDDRLRGLHAGAVLDRAGDAVGDVELRRDGLAGLADLEGVRVPPGVDRGAGRADRRAERVGEALDLGEVAAGATTTGDHDRGLGQLGTAGGLAGLGRGDPGALRRVGDRRRERLLGAGAVGLLRASWSSA